MASDPRVPPLEERERPGLSATLNGPRAPDRCQACGKHRELTRWIEHDPWDRPTRVLVVLCGSCGRLLIDAHARLYKALRMNQPWPGCMGICLRCEHRDGTACTHPDQKALGGPGLAITIATPTRAHLNFGRGRGEWVDLYDTPASDCAGRTVKVPA